MSKLKIYLETTIPNAVFNNHTPTHQKHAQKLFIKIQRGMFEAYVSSSVIQELSLATKNKRTKILKLLEKIPVLKEVKIVRELADAYIQAEMVTEKHRNDALHIAMATYYKMDLIVSYNLDHIVRLSTKEKVEEVNRQFKYLSPRIVLPEEIV